MEVDKYYLYKKEDIFMKQNGDACLWSVMPFKIIKSNENCFAILAEGQIEILDKRTLSGRVDFENDFSLIDNGIDMTIAPHINSYFRK